LVAERSDSRGSAVANMLPAISTKINDTIPTSPRATSPRTISKSLTSITETSAAAAAQAAAASGNNNDIISIFNLPIIICEYDSKIGQKCN